MNNKSSNSDKKAKRTVSQSSQKNITKTKGADDAKNNSIENKLNNCKG